MNLHAAGLWHVFSVYSHLIEILTTLLEVSWKRGELGKGSSF